MRTSIVSRFAAALIVSALVPLAAMAQDATTTTPSAPAKTPTTTPRANAPQRNMRKITSRYMMGNRPVASRGMAWRNRQFHRGTSNGRFHTGHHRTSGNMYMPTGTAANANHAAATGKATTATNTGTASKKASSGAHKHPTGKHKARQTSARHSGKTSGHVHSMNFSRRR